MIWEPFVLALVLGLIVSAGLYFAYMWPAVEPAHDPPVVEAPPAPVPEAAAPAAEAKPAEASPVEAAP